MCQTLQLSTYRSAMFSHKFFICTGHVRCSGSPHPSSYISTARSSVSTQHTQHCPTQIHRANQNSCDKHVVCFHGHRATQELGMLPGATNKKHREQVCQGPPLSCCGGSTHYTLQVNASPSQLNKQPLCAVYQYSGIQPVLTPTIRMSYAVVISRRKSV
jgi:hypothetical protein